MTMLARVMRTVLFCLVAGGIAAQGQESDTARLRRDQAEILRKAERLRDVMQRLLDRYEQEGRAEQAKRLRAGLEHLEAAKLLEDVAGIRADLHAEARSRAVEKQGEVVAELDRLLAILLDRRSLESLEREIASAARLAGEAGQLLDRQRELRAQSQATTEQGATAAEDRLAGARRDLANRQRNEAQAALRAGLAAGPAGGRRAPRREQSAALGDLGGRARELIDARRRQPDWQRARAAAAELEKAAAAGDAQARARAQQRLQDVLERLARSPRGDDGAATRAAADALA